MSNPTPEQLARAVLTPTNPKARETLKKLREKAEKLDGTRRDREV